MDSLRKPLVDADCWNRLQLDTSDYADQKTMLVDRFWDWLTKIEDSYNLPQKTILHVKWSCDFELDSSDINETVLSDAEETERLKAELEELKRQKLLLEEGKLFHEKNTSLNLDIDDEIPIGPDTARLLGKSSELLTIDSGEIMTVTESERMAQLDEALATTAELFKELGLDMGDLDLNFGDQSDTIDEGTTDEKKEWPPKPKKKQWPPKPQARASSANLHVQQQRSKRPSVSTNATNHTPEQKKAIAIADDGPWTCHACNTPNTKGKFCHLCSVEKLPPGYPLPPFVKPGQFSGTGQEAYKEWMRQKAKYEIWENSLILYRLKFKEGKGQDCLNILTRLKEQGIAVQASRQVMSPKERTTSPWTCLHCSTQNTRGTKCNKCREYKIPDGFPQPPKDKSKYDKWKSAIHDYYVKFEEGNLEACSNIKEEIKVEIESKVAIAKIPKWDSSGLIDKTEKKSAKGKDSNPEKKGLALDLTKLNNADEQNLDSKNSNKDEPDEDTYIDVVVKKIKIPKRASGHGELSKSKKAAAEKNKKREKSVSTIDKDARPEKTKTEISQQHSKGSDQSEEPEESAENVRMRRAKSQGTIKSKIK